MKFVRFLAVALIFSFIFGLQPSITQDADAKGAKGKGATSVKAKANRAPKSKTSVSKKGSAKKQGKVKKEAKRAGKKIKKGAKKAKAKAKQTLQKAKSAVSKGGNKARQKVKKGVQRTAKAVKGAKDSTKKARDKLLSKLKKDRQPINKTGKGKLTKGEARELQNIANKYKTKIEVVGSRARGEGRNIANQKLPVGKGRNTRSDIDIRMSGQKDINTRGRLSSDLSNVGRGSGQPRPRIGESKGPTITFKPE